MGASKGKVDKIPVLLCSFDDTYEEQKLYCIKLINNFRHEKIIKYEINGGRFQFIVSFRLNNKTYIIQDIFDNSEIALNNSLDKIYTLLDGGDILEESKKDKKNDKSIETKQNKNQIKTLFFESNDQRIINYKLDCNKDSIFKDIEEKLYKKFVEFRNIKKYYLCNGSTININKTLEENKIKDNSHILIVIHDISIINNESLSSAIHDISSN